MNQRILLLPWGAFVAFTVYVVAFDGFSPLFVLLSDGGWGTQVFVDLCISILLVDFFIYHDARRQGRSPWPWILGSFAIGSIAPLAYFAFGAGPKVSSA
ncbi:MAG: hypothetical protein AAF938_28040 [Myxococcota bacterium]